MRLMIMKSFITSHFGCCPLIWMFHSRPLDNKINSIHERALRTTYNDRKSTFDQLFNKNFKKNFMVQKNNKYVRC